MKPGIANVHSAGVFVSYFRDETIRVKRIFILGVKWRLK